MTGLSQSIGRAELTAVLATARWAISFGVQVHIWSDSKYIVNRVQAWIDNVECEATITWEHFDLWQMLFTELERMGRSAFRVTWVPSHLDYTKCESQIEEWISIWNGQADQLAVTMNHCRSSTAQYMLDQEAAYFDHWSQIAWRIRGYLLEVADLRLQGGTSTSGNPQQETINWTELVGTEPFSELLPINWQHQLHGGACQLPASFAIEILSRTIELEDDSDFSAITMIELTLWLAKIQQVKFPFWNSDFSRWDLCSIEERFTRPTLAFLLRLVRKAFVEAFSLLNLDAFFRRGLYCPAATSTQDGLILRAPRSFRQSTKSLLDQFVVGGRIRKAADLARPIT